MQEMESQQERRLGEIAYFPFLGFLPADDWTAFRTELPRLSLTASDS